MNLSLCAYEAVPHNLSKAGIVIGGTWIYILQLLYYKYELPGFNELTLI